MIISRWRPQPQLTGNFSHANSWSSIVSEAYQTDKHNFLSAGILQNYWDLSNVPAPPTGTLVINNARVIGDWGLVLDTDLGMIGPTIQEFGWADDHLDIAVARLGGRIVSSGIELPDRYAIHADSELDEALLLAWPGINTFGHWIVDVPARIQMAINSGFGTTQVAIIGQAFPWQPRVLSALGKPGMQLFPADNRTIVVKKLVIPSLSRNNEFITRQIYTDLFAKSNFKQKKGSGVLLLKHTPVTSTHSRAVLSNFSELERYVHSIGGEVLDPLEQPLEILQREISKAAILIGEDSSALHNIALSDNNCGLIVISTDRENLLHAGLQSLRQGLIDYVSTSHNSDRVEINAVSDSIRRMLTTDKTIPDKANHHFISYVDPKRQVGSQSEVPGIMVADRTTMVSGYQSFTIVNGRVDRTTISEKYRKLVRYLEHNRETMVAGRSMIDIGCSAGLLCLLSLEAGFSSAFGHDHDPEYISLAKSLLELYDLNMKVSVGNWRDTLSSYDTVFLLAIIHWIFSKTSDEGSFEKIFCHLHSVTNQFLIIEWVDPMDPAILDLKHTSANKNLQVVDYSLNKFLDAGARYFGRVDAKLSTSPTRCIYVFCKERRAYGYSSVVSFNTSCVVKTFHDRVVKHERSLIERERRALSTLSGVTGFPILLDFSDRDISMISSGEPLTYDNIPENAEEQGRLIVDAMKMRGVRHNDIHPGNLFVKDGCLQLIDFGWASFGSIEPDYLPSIVGVDHGVRHVDEPFDDQRMLDRSLQLIRGGCV